MIAWDPTQKRFVLVWFKPPDWKPYVSEYDAFANPPDPPGLKICRPSSAHYVVDTYVSYGVTETHPAVVHSCDGNGCECPTCDIFSKIREMSEYLDQRDIEDSWPR